MHCSNQPIVSLPQVVSIILINGFLFDLHSEEVKLKGHGMHLRYVDSPLNAYFAFDWVHGLLYYAEERKIYVANLANTPNQEILEIYSSEDMITINGLVVRPDNATLCWIEYDKQRNLVAFMQSLQVRLE